MNNLFFYDQALGVKKTYDDLISDISNESKFCQFCKSKSYYEIFKSIIISLILGKEIVLLDSDFTDGEIENLVGKEIDITSSCTDLLMPELSINSLIQLINENSATWKITLFTSGTTGLPKKISHSFSSISRFVKKNDRHLQDIWGFSYNPTHMAGLQVFFQAILNLNPIIRLFGLDRDEILTLISTYKITNISATPTFYRLLLPTDCTLESVKRLTSGGEKFDSNTLYNLQIMFPNSKITNVYASTEAGSLFASTGDEFTIKDDIKNFVKIENDQLYLHKSLLGDSNTLIIDGDWYQTGDLIAIVNDNPLTFKFVSRTNDMINVGGYKVNPLEVEDAIRKYKGVKDVCVYAKKSSILGNIVCCEVITDDDNISELRIREFLKTKLQEFKIPRIVKFVEKLKTTRTGKIARK